MYRKVNSEQLGIEEFFLPFGGKLQKDNRWVKMAEIMPWDLIELTYLKTMSSEKGRTAYSARLAYGAIFIKEHEGLTDEQTVTAITENPYMQYFLGMSVFTETAPFDASMMVHFRKRFPVEDLAIINEAICLGKTPEKTRNVDRNDSNDNQDNSDNDNNNSAPPADGIGQAKSWEGKPNKNTSKKKQKRQKKNRGKLLMDATVAPADIKYPTDIDLLNQCREHLEKAIDLLWNNMPHTRHKLPYSKKNARKSYLNLAKSKRWTNAKCKKAIGDQLRFVGLAYSTLKEYEQQIPGYEKLYPYWLMNRLAVIPKVYEQQKQMYESGTHKCNERIVSLQQPHVRPINRGKRPNPTEFGQKLHLSVVNGYTYLEQTSWENFNEGTDLIATAEDYRRKFGYYPEVILADKIYQTRSNREYCSEHGIRLSGPPLGRRKASQTDEKIHNQMYRDACERNAIEGRNGNAKRRWGLNRIMTKLDETSKTEAMLNIIAMNVSHKLALWFLRFFQIFSEKPIFQ